MTVGPRSHTFVAYGALVSIKTQSIANTSTSVRANQMTIKLEEKIGEGFYADVWRATDRFGRKVAVKTLRRSAPHYADAMAHAKALAKTQHSNVVTVFSLETVTIPGTDEVVDGIVMELIEGQTLQDRLEQNLLNPDDVFALSNALIDGLEHIHSVGLTHNDLHSRNILVQNNKLKIIDILYTDTLSQTSTRSKKEKTRRDIRDLTTTLYDIAQRSSISEIPRKQFGLAINSSEMSFTDMREALQTLYKAVEAESIPLIKRSDIGSLQEGHLRKLGRAFKEHRMSLADNKKLPLDWEFLSGGRIIFHAYPFSDEALDKAIIRNKAKQDALFKPIGPLSGWSYDITKEGIITYRPERKYGYCYLFNDASCETIDMFSLGSSDNPDELKLPARYLVDYFAEYLNYYSDCYRKLGFKKQIWCCFSLAGIRGWQLGTDNRRHWSPRPIRTHRDSDFIFPEIIIPSIENGTLEPFRLIRSGFDELWQTFGYERCFLYDESGSYVTGR